MRTIFLHVAMTILSAMTFVSLGSCTDPVFDDTVASMGDDPEAPGPLHRAGKPCVICHSRSGPASNSPFSVAGTIYESASSPKGAAFVQVRLRAADGSERIGTTNEAGNFYFSKEAWDPRFPLHVDIYRPGDVAKKMTSMIGREGSCAACHFAAPPTSYTADARAVDYQPFMAVGPIVLKQGTP